MANSGYIVFVSREGSNEYPMFVGHTQSLDALLERLQIGSPVKLAIVAAAYASPMEVIKFRATLSGYSRACQGGWFERSDYLDGICEAVSWGSVSQHPVSA
jgi:hypothetical protein